MIGFKHCLKTVNNQCHVEYVKINRCRQLSPDGLEDVDYSSNVAGSSPTHYQLFSSVFVLIL